MNEELFADLQRQIDSLERRIVDLEVREELWFKTVYLVDGVSTPATETGWGIIYIDSSDGDLKIKFGNGFVATIVADS